MNILKNNLLYKHGRVVIIYPTFLILVFGTLFYYFSYIVSAYLLFFLSFLLFFFGLYFFRNPNRVCLELIYDKNVLVSPADGKVVSITDVDFDGFVKRVSIFLSPFDVHVNWLPMGKKIVKSEHKPGKFLFAFVEKSSELNERHDIVISNNNDRILVRQIAGMVARRIVCWVNLHENVHAGQKYGMIKFSSRVDIFLPKNVKINLQLGQRVYGGQTVLGRWQSC